jgi:hypothetical protein
MVMPLARRYIALRDEAQSVSEACARQYGVLGRAGM